MDDKVVSYEDTQEKQYSKYIVSLFSLVYLNNLSIYTEFFV